MSRIRYAVLSVSLLLTAVLMAACGATPVPTQTPTYVTATPLPIPPTDTPTSTPVATATNVPTRVPTATTVPTKAPAAAMKTYSGTYASFSIQYPASWAVKPNDLPLRGGVTFSGSDGSALLLTYDPNTNKLPAETIRDNYLIAFGVPNLKVGNKRLNADGSANADITFDDPGSKTPLQGMVRVVLVTQGVEFYYILTFAAPTARYAAVRELGLSMMDSLHVGL